MKPYKPETDEVLSLLLSRLSLSLSSCFSSPVIVDFIKIDNGLLTLQLCLNAKQRISEKRAGDEFTHSDKGGKSRKSVAASHLKISLPHLGTSKWGLFRRKLKCAQLSACPETRN